MAPASAKLNLPTKKLGNDNYYYYEVKKNETIFDIANKIGVSKDDIIKFNPSAKNGVAKKQLIFLPVKEFDGTAKAATTRRTNINVPNDAATHIVKSGESVYGIAKAYNVTENELLTANPSLNNGLQVGDQLIIPAKTITNSSDSYIYHTVKSGETLYGIARTYNTTIEKLIEANPGIDGSVLKADEVIRIVPNTTQDIVVNKDIFQFTPYVVAGGDTYQSVAQASGITVEQLRAANPDTKKLKKGKTIYIPRKAIDKQVVNTSSLNEKQLEEAYKDKIDDIRQDVIAPNKNNSIDISVILPFQLGMKDQTRNATNYVEFYNGFLLALDSVGSKLTKPLNLNVYDTKHNLNITDSLLAIEKLKTSDIIIAPSEPKQLERILNYGKKNNIDVLNCFAAQNDDYISNSRVMQVNIPSPYLNARINELLDTKFKDYVLVYLDDPQEESKDIYDEIKKHASEVKHQNKTLTIASELSGKTLSKYLEPGSSYLFIPANGKESLLNKFATGLIEAKKNRIDCDLVLLGHPEYTMYIKKHKDELMAMDTYIYSRFYLPDNNNVNDIKNRYVKTFGTSPSNSTPNMSVFGFDVGMFLVNAYASGVVPGSKESAHNGIQTNFNFERANNWAGYINKSVRIIHLTPKNELKILDLNDQ
jgi:LysM repeat protein